MCVDTNKAVSCLCGNQYDCSGVNITSNFVNNCGVFRGVSKRSRLSKGFYVYYSSSEALLVSPCQ